MSRMRRVVVWVCLLIVLVPPGSVGLAQETPRPVFVPLVTNGPASGNLIDGAVARGEISAEQGLLYHVYAAFGDPRLPPPYRGNVAAADADVTRLHEAAAQWDSLSAATQQALAPFLTPPMYAGSWGDPARYAVNGLTGLAEGEPPIPCREGAMEALLPGWARFETAHAYVWFPLDGQPDLGITPQQATAAATWVAEEIETVWAKLVALTARQPLSDAGEVCNGGDGRFDIYIYRHQLSTGGATVGYPPGCEARPAFIWLAPDPIQTLSVAQFALAHEFMHSITFTYDLAAACGEYRWLDEATANWAVDYIYPDNNREHRYAYEYIGQDHDASLNTSNILAGGHNGYNDYLFLFFLARHIGPNVIARAWDETPTKGSLAALEHVLPGGFATQWPAFALYNVNRAPVNQYQTWDGLAAGYDKPGALPRPPRDFALPMGQASATFDLGRTYMTYLASTYGHYRFDDARVRHVEFNDFGFEPDAAAGGKVQAWLKLGDGTARVEDWTGKETVSFCRDKPEEDVREVIVVWSQSVIEPEDGTAYNTHERKVTVTDEGCGCGEWRNVAGFTGSFATSYAATGSKPTSWGGTQSYDVSREVNVNFSLELTRTVTTSAVWWEGDGISGGAVEIEDVNTIVSPNNTAIYTIAGNGAPYGVGRNDRETNAVVYTKPDGACVLWLTVMARVLAEDDLLNEQLYAQVAELTIREMPLPAQVQPLGGTETAPVRLYTSLRVGTTVLLGGEGWADALATFIIGEDALGTTSVTWSLTPTGMSPAAP